MPSRKVAHWPVETQCTDTYFLSVANKKLKTFYIHIHTYTVHVDISYLAYFVSAAE